MYTLITELTASEMHAIQDAIAKETKTAKDKGLKKQYKTLINAYRKIYRDSEKKEVIK